MPDVLSRPGYPALFDVQREHRHRLASPIAVFFRVKLLHALLEFRGDFSARQTPVGEKIQNHDAITELVERNRFVAFKLLQRERRNRCRRLGQRRIHPNEDCCKEYQPEYSQAHGYLQEVQPAAFPPPDAAEPGSICAINRF